MRTGDYRHLLSLSTPLALYGLTGEWGDPGDDGSTAIAEEAGKMRTFVLRIRVSI